MILRPSQVGQALERDGSILPSKVRLLLLGHWAWLTLVRMLILSEGATLLTVKAYVSLLSMSQINKADTYYCKSPVPNSGRHIKEVFSFHLKVFQPAGDVTT